MDDQTLDALRGSIAKWEAIVAGTGVDKGGKNCPLCRMFFRDIPLCAGCPVSIKSGMTDCRGTPYAACLRAEDSYGTGSPEYRRAAQAEVDFLRSLLPQTDPALSTAQGET